MEKENGLGSEWGWGVDGCVCERLNVEATTSPSVRHVDVRKGYAEEEEEEEQEVEDVFVFHMRRWRWRCERGEKNKTKWSSGAARERLREEDVCFPFFYYY